MCPDEEVGKPLHPERPRIDRSDRGQTIVTFALFLVLLVGFVALSIDVGHLLSERRAAQNAADAAALAAGKLLSQNEPAATVRNAAVAYATLNGFADDGSTTTVDVGFPKSNEVEVEIHQQVPKFFLGAVYSGAWAVAAKAVARVDYGTGPFALIALGKDKDCGSKTGIEFDGNGTVTISGGSVGSNACITVNGNSLDAEVGNGNIQAYGEVDDPHRRLEVNPGYWIAGDQGIIPDPYDGVVPPSCDAMPPMDESIAEDPDDKDKATLSPGRYTGKIAKKRIELLPGIYCFEDEVKANGSGAYIKTVESGRVEGALLYFRNGGELTLTGGAVFQVKKLGTAWDEVVPEEWSSCDVCKNIVVWMDPGAANPFNASGNQKHEIVGVIYAPRSRVELGGTSDTAVLTGMVVADSIKIHGNATLNLVTNFDYTAQPRPVYLID